MKFAPPPLPLQPHPPLTHISLSLSIPFPSHIDSDDDLLAIYLPIFVCFFLLIIYLCKVYQCVKVLTLLLLILFSKGNSVTLVNSSNKECTALITNKQSFEVQCLLSRGLLLLLLLLLLIMAV